MTKIVILALAAILLGLAFNSDASQFRYLKQEIKYINRNIEYNISYNDIIECDKNQNKFNISTRTYTTYREFTLVNSAIFSNKVCLAHQNNVYYLCDYNSGWCFVAKEMR